MKDQTDDTVDLNTSIARLEDFIGTYSERDAMDADTPLTVDDVRRVIEAAKRGAQVVPVRTLKLSGPSPDDLT